MICDQPRPLQDARILVAEDDAILAYDMQSLLRDAGAVIFGPGERQLPSRAIVRARTRAHNGTYCNTIKTKETP